MQFSTEPKAMRMLNSLQNYVAELEEQNTKLRAENKALMHALNKKPAGVIDDDSEQLRSAITAYYHQKIANNLRRNTDPHAANVLKQLEQILAHLDSYLISSMSPSISRRMSSHSPQFTFGHKHQGTEQSFKLKLKQLPDNDQNNAHTSQEVVSPNVEPNKLTPGTDIKCTEPQTTGPHSPIEPDRKHAKTKHDKQRRGLFGTPNPIGRK